MMAPRLAEAYGYRFVFYSAEVLSNEPPHVHIEGYGGRMKVWLETLEVADCKGISAQQKKIIKNS